MSSNPTWIYLCPISCSGCGEPRGIVVTGMDPWPRVTRVPAQLQLSIPLVTKEEEKIFTILNFLTSNIVLYFTVLLGYHQVIYLVAAATDYALFHWISSSYFTLQIYQLIWASFVIRKSILMLPESNISREMRKLSFNYKIFLWLFFRI